MASVPPITISLTRYNEPNDFLHAVLDAVAQQEDVCGTVLLLDQRANAATRNHCMALSTGSLRFVYTEIDALGLSRARNLAIDASDTDILLYLDADAIPECSWASLLSDALTEGDAAIAGGRILPAWPRSPGILQRSAWVVEQYSMLDLGDGTLEVDRIVGASMGINRARLGEEARFDEELGRRDGRLFGGEESDLCRRARVAGLRVSYVGAAVVHHHVADERMQLPWVLRRIYHAGFNRARAGGMPKPRTAPARFSRWDWIALVLLAPVYLAGACHAGVLGSRRSVSSLSADRK